jgi:hypothetical protein
MSKDKGASSRFQQVIEQRLIQHRRAELAADSAEARQAYQEGEVRRGTVADLMEELAA